MAPPIRFVASSAKSAYGSIYLRCHVKPGASRQCILAISPTQVDVSVTGQAKDNEANKAVGELISAILKVPKSDVTVAKGLKSRDKVVVVGGIDPQGDEENLIARIRKQLQDSIE